MWLPAIAQRLYTDSLFYWHFFLLTCYLQCPVCNQGNQPLSKVVSIHLYPSVINGLNKGLQLLGLKVLGRGPTCLLCKLNLIVLSTTDG